MVKCPCEIRESNDNTASKVMSARNNKIQALLTSNFGGDSLHDCFCFKPSLANVSTEYVSAELSGVGVLR